ncbi:MAG: N-acetylmuramoyl-L-alanine amidase [Bacteroidales bacterium]|nr:N-acetylmuramoyl-L-alanine amidase [Bacteroidales bacterium]
MNFSRNKGIPCIIIFLFIGFSLLGQNEGYVATEAGAGDGVIHLLKRYGLNPGTSNLNHFREINQIKGEMVLREGSRYRLPIQVYSYNEKSIRSTIGRNDWDLAVKIRDYNELMHRKNLRKEDYRKDKILWVPVEYLEEPVTENKTNPSSGQTQIKYPVFGKDQEVVEIKSDRLSGHVYYIVSGHGGPDPGAIGKYNGHSLCEDEYAYDIALRLARCLIEQSATVHLIIRDDDDGIRDETILKPDKDEKCMGKEKIPLNQMARLKQRTGAINELYRNHKKNGNPVQRAIILHLDSRSSRQRIDMFFYHSPNSSNGKKLASSLRNKIEEKYNRHQKNRGYTGTVEERNLYVLRNTLPVAVFIEMGNIKNSLDQKRFILKDNRQAIAHWLCEGLLEASDQ